MRVSVIEPRAREPRQRRTGEDGKIQVRFFPGCLVLSLVLSIGGTILLNVLLRAFN